MQQRSESSSILPTHQSRISDKYATPDQFREALDRERNKVADFYRSKYEEIRTSFDRMEEEIAALEDRDLGPDDVIKEEDEDEDGVDDEAGEGEALLSPQTPKTPARPPAQPHKSMFSRLAPAFGRYHRRKSAVPGQHEADIMEASIGSTRRARSRSVSGGMEQSISSFGADDRPRSRVPGPKRGRRSSEMDSEDGGGTVDRRTSFSSASSHERDLGWPRRAGHSLGLVAMDRSDMPSIIVNGPPSPSQEQVSHEGNGHRQVLVWTANNDYGTVLRISFKKRISAVWLEAYALKQYVELNLTAFEKILKK